MSVDELSVSGTMTCGDVLVGMDMFTAAVVAIESNLLS